MDKAKGIVKGGWHPSGDKAIHRATWKSDIKGVATGKTPDKKHLEDARNHQSVPLASLKDPDSFGPPPRQTSAVSSPTSSTHPTISTPTSATRPRPPTGGLGSPVPPPKWKQEAQEAEEQGPPPPPVPYRTDTTGLRTDNLPKPPARRVELDGASSTAPAPPPRFASPASPSLPSRPQQPPAPPQSRARPIPTLPPRMNDHPDEFTPPPPPPYQEATKPAAQNPALLNQGALNRLSQAGVSVPGFGIGSNAATNTTQAPSNPQGHGGQLSELQQRFSRMGTGGNNPSSAPVLPSPANLSAVAAAAQKKAPPPPPPKKPDLANGSGSRPSTADATGAPPPLPLSSKPRPS